MIGHFLVEWTPKLLKWIEENLPDNPRLGRKVFLVGCAILAATLVPGILSRGIFGDAIIFCGLSLGFTCMILGGYILFRRGIWNWQDKRPPRITSLRWE